jgi:hypothetical protein
MIVTKRFYKENGMWFIDLPEFLEKGLGTKANLLMVAGADELLDILSQNGTEITLQFGDEIFIGSNVQLNFRGYGKDQTFLDYVGHAPVDNGAYYEAYNTEWLGFEFKISSLWLCPVTEYIFNGNYPKNIFLKYFII